MCFVALSRKRFLERFRPGHDRVFWDGYIKRWLSYNKKAMVLKAMKDPFALIWFYDNETSKKLGSAYRFHYTPNYLPRS